MEKKYYNNGWINKFVFLKKKVDFMCFFHGVLAAWAILNWLHGILIFGMVHFGGNLGLGIWQKIPSISISQSAFIKATETIGWAQDSIFNLCQISKCKTPGLTVGMNTLFNQFLLLQLSAIGTAKG